MMRINNKKMIVYQVINFSKICKFVLVYKVFIKVNVL